MDVRTLCLGILSLGDASGYEIKKRLENHFRHFYDASFGSIYPALNKMQEDGLVSCTHEAQSRRPDKKVYSLTVDGRLELIAELSRPPSDDRLRSEFLVKMFFGDLLPAHQVSTAIDARLAKYRREIAELAAIDCDQLSPGKQFVIGYGIALYEAAARYMEENRHLVEGEALLAQVSNDRNAGRGAAGGGTRRAGT